MDLVSAELPAKTLAEAMEFESVWLAPAGSLD